MIRKLFLFLAILVWVAPALAGVSPHEVILTIPYGNAPGELDTLRVDADDPFRTLVQSFVIEADDTVWVLPRVEVAGRTVLYAYNNNSFTRELPFTGYAMGFVRAAEGVYSWTAGGNRAIAALVAFDPGPGRGDVHRAELPAGNLTPSGFDGWMGLVDGSACLFGRAPGNQLFTVRLGTDLRGSVLSDVVRGVSADVSLGPSGRTPNSFAEGTRCCTTSSSWTGGWSLPFRTAGSSSACTGRRTVRSSTPVSRSTMLREFKRTIVALPRTDKFAVGGPPVVLHDRQLLPVAPRRDRGAPGAF